MTTLPSPQFATPSSTDSSNAAATTEFVNQFMAGLRTVTPVAATTAKQTTFTIPNGYNPGFINVYLNGLFLIGGTDYNGSGGEVITLSTTAADNVVVGSELVVENFAPLGASDTSDYFPKSGGTITGGVTVTGVLTMSSGGVSVTPATTDNSTNVATTEYVQKVVAGISPGGGDEDLSDYLTKEDASTTYLALTGGTITGTLKAPTLVDTDNSTNVATTAFVKTALSNITPEGDLSDYLKIADAETTYLPLTGGTINGSLIVNDDVTDGSIQISASRGNSPSIQLFGTAGTSNRDISWLDQASGIRRWAIQVRTPEDSIDGSNVGSDFVISGFGDTSTSNNIGICLSIKRADGIVNMPHGAVTKTQAATDNSTNVATTAYVQNNLDEYLPLTGGTLTGTLTASSGINTSSLTCSTHILINYNGANAQSSNINFYSAGGTAQSAYILASGGTSGTGNSGTLQLTASSLILDAPSLKLGNSTATVTAPTPAVGDNSTNVATTAFVQSNLENYPQTPYGQDIKIAYIAYSPALECPYFRDIPGNTYELAQLSNLSKYLPLTGGNITGTLTAPTPATTDNSTNVATTEFVKTALSGTSSAPVDPTYTVSTLPATPVVGERAFATNGCKPGEDTGTGTGVPVFYDGTNWCSYCSGTTVSS